MKIKHLLITAGVVSELLGWRYLYNCKYDKREEAKQLLKTLKDRRDDCTSTEQEANQTTQELVLYSGLELLGLNVMSVLIVVAIPVFIVASPVIIPGVILAKLIGPNAGR